MSKIKEHIEHSDSGLNVTPLHTEDRIPTLLLLARASVNDEELFTSMLADIKAILRD